MDYSEKLIDAIKEENLLIIEGFLSDICDIEKSSPDLFLSKVLLIKSKMELYVKQNTPCAHNMKWVHTNWFKCEKCGYVESRDINE